MRRAFGPCPARGPPASTLGPGPAEALFDLVAKPGLRWGTAFATVMLVLPLLLMLNQVVRLGTATRERRLAALRLAGATPAEVRRISAFEVGFPVTVGAMSGPLVFALLRELFGGEGVDPASLGGYGYFFPGSTLSLIPPSVTPAWWQTIAVVALVAAAGVVTGALASRHLIASPLGVSRRVRRPAPRPWGLLLVVLGAVALAPWVAFRSGQRSARRTSDPATLIAAGHLVSDPRPAGQAAAAVGAIGIVSGAAAVFETSIFFGNIGRDGDPFFVTSYALVGVALILVLLVTASTLAVHAGCCWPRHRRTCVPSSRDDLPTCPRSQPEALAGNDPAPHRCPPCRTPRKNTRRCCRAARSWRPPSRTRVTHHLGELFAGARPRSNGTSAATTSCHRQGRARRSERTFRSRQLVPRLRSPDTVGEVTIMVETVSRQDQDKTASSARFRKLPERIRPEDMIAAQETEPPPDPTMGRDSERDFMLRNAGF